MANRASDNGVFYGFTSESDCAAACLSSSSCVSVDLGPLGCLLHNNIVDLKSARYAPGVTQLVLNRYCLSTTPRSTTKSATVATENYTNTLGINITKIQFIIRVTRSKSGTHFISAPSTTENITALYQQLCGPVS